MGKVSTIISVMCHINNVYIVMPTDKTFDLTHLIVFFVKFIIVFAGRAYML